MKFKKRFGVLFLVCVGMLANGVVAQDNLRSQLFSEVDAIKAQAEKRQANVLAPNNYGKAMKAYQRAEQDLRKGRNLQDIRKRIREAQAYFKKAIEATKLAEVTFAAVTAARNDAISADAAKFARATWEKAEEKLIEAAKELEKGDVKDAMKRGKKAEELYRQAELEAIKANFLTPAWTLLDKADRLKVGRNAPRTLARARELAQKAEDLLRQNRYDNDEARQLAQEAKYEAAHAIFLNDLIEKYKDADLDFEDVFLLAEQPLQKIGGTLDIVTRFDKGYDPPTEVIINKIKDLQDKLRLALEVIEKRNAEIKTLQEQIASMEQRLGSLTAAEKALQEKLERQRRQEMTFFEVAKMFTRSEAQVLRDGNHVIIRLYGLTFPVGRAIIEPQFFSLLTKVQNALRKFPNANVIIEGHTDSQGSDKQNQSLSEKRAEAVRQYLLANMNWSPGRIHAVGYGESRPIASNDTPEGRAKNRRIDIVIIPEWAQSEAANQMQR